MPKAAAFIGGGLLQGIGQGIATQGAEDRKASAAQALEAGKDKRERALADLEYRRGLERDDRKMAGQKGLLTTRLEAESKRPQSDPGRIAADIGSGLLPEGYSLESAGGADSQPAVVKEAEWLMATGIAKTKAEAYKIANGGVYSPQKIYKSAWTKIYTEQLRNFANEADAKSAADSGAAAIMVNMETMFGPGGTGAVEPPPKDETPEEPGLFDRGFNSAKDFLFGGDEPNMKVVPSTLTPSPATPALAPVPAPQAAPPAAPVPAVAPPSTQAFDPATAAYEAVMDDGTAVYSTDGRAWFYADGRPVAQ